MYNLHTTPKNILVVFRTAQLPLRMTTQEHLYSFRKYSNRNVFYLNLALLKPPWYITKVKFDLIIFDTIFMTNHWDPNKFKRLIERSQILKNIDAIKVALPQDEFINTDLLCDFINEFDISYVFSVAPETEWPKIYHKVDFQKVRFFRVLTGYLDNHTLVKIRKLLKKAQERTIDIGYRASGKPLPWFGRHGYLKQQIAEVFENKVNENGLNVDISTENRDVFLGFSWYKFLLRCKYTIGVEGGTSILDRDGMIRKKTEGYLAVHPKADFEEIESTCFPDVDNNFHYVGISPRHLEACATKTCQVLTEGEYNGILKPALHYIELKRDFSNIEQVLEVIKQDNLRQGIIERAYQDIVDSEKYTYKSFVNFVIEKSLSSPSCKTTSPNQFRDKIIYYLIRWRECISWIAIALYCYFTAPIRKSKIIRRY